MLENKFKTKLKKEIEERCPGSMVMHLDPNEIQGIPDLVVFYKNKWAVLEGKKARMQRNSRIKIITWIV